MKHSVVFKFIAVALCALSLTGAIASGLGILALTETGLYNKTVDQVIEERVLRQGERVSLSLAARYASMTLGGSSPQLAYDRYPELVDIFGSYGYSLMDAEGNILDSDLPASRDYQTYTFPISGKYVHVISLMTEEEKYPSTQSNVPAQAGSYRNGEAYIYDAIPPEGAAVMQFFFNTVDGNDYDYADGSGIGTAYYSADGKLVCMLTNQQLDFPYEETIFYLCLIGLNGELLYEASDPNGIGCFTLSGNTPMFLGTVAAPEELPETTEVTETFPETVPVETTAAIQETAAPEETAAAAETRAAEQTEPPETQAAETAAEETTVDETVASSASAVPEETGAAEETEEAEAAEETEAQQTVPPTEAATEPPATEAATEPPATEAAAEPAATEPITINGKPLDEFDINNTTYYNENHEKIYAEYVYVPMPEYTVELYLNEDDFVYSDAFEVLRIVRHYRQYLLPVLAASILVFVIFAVYLCCAAGHRPKTEEIRAGGLNRIPLDLYLLLGGSAICGLVVLAADGGSYLLRQNLSLGVACGLGSGFAACLIGVGFLFACVAQWKTPGGFWWRNTLCGICIRWFMKFALWLEEWLAHKGFPFCGRLIRALWKLTLSAMAWMYKTTEKLCLWTGRHLGRMFRWISRKVHRFLILLPLTWQWLLVGFVIIIISIGFINNTDPNMTVVGVILVLAIILYAAHCFGLLAESVKRMSKGDLDTKVDDKLLVGCFQEFSDDLNNLAGVAVVAAQKQLKSERMKTELITNVSHDIKTPLTSIINYVDLLQKPHTEEEEAQYLEVLDRQSQRLKKLIEDLMDMSKASTGNMTVEITQVDAVESINQALGEFADKLEKARLFPVFRHTEPSAAMMADGKLVWRVLSNLLGNAVKYAMPGTRLYVDLTQVDNQVVISLKNISREELNVDAEELMERFVRGDDSRNTEGSGLGLNITKSLMELQKGQLQLLVDGDLFKVTLIFPGA